jgi:predicted short-subunit dehydrogenase-like oxidoreductase (DUF2520 family)
MRATIANGFELTGPIARGDWQVAERHLDELGHLAPEIAAMYGALARATVESSRWQVHDDSNDVAPPAADVPANPTRP